MTHIRHKRGKHGGPLVYADLNFEDGSTERVSASAMKYPNSVSADITQYDEHVFVWMDETGNAGGVATTKEEAQRQLTDYSNSMDAVWLRDLDDTGSMHPCLSTDPGAVMFVRAEK